MASKLTEEIKEIMMKIPQMIHHSVPLGKSDEENIELEKIGEPVVPDFGIFNHAELAEKLNISWPTAKKKYENLKERGVIVNPIAIYYPEKIGLKRINVYCYVNSKEAMKIVERSCYEHPYTIYRGQVYCAAFGLFIQYNIP